MKFNQYISWSWLVWTVLVGLLLVLASDLSLSADSTNKFDWISYNRSEVGFSHACSYYTLTNAGNGVLPSGKINSLRINEWVLVHGNVSNERWEWERNVSYIVQVPDYGEVWANYSCNTSWQFNGSTYLCERLFGNESSDCVSLYSLNSINDTCEFNYTGVISHHPETRYKLVWMEFNPPDFNPSDIILQSGESQSVRVCADLTREVTDRGWTIEVDHIPEFDVFTYPEWAWWNSSYLYKRTQENGSPSLTEFMIPIDGKGGGYTDIDGNGINEVIYGEYFDSTSAIYYNDENDTAYANDTVEGYKVQTLPEQIADGREATVGVPTHGLVLFLPLDEDDTYAWDYSVKDNDGTLGGSITQNVTGKIGKGYSFDGSDDYISLTSSGITANASRTLLLWANANTFLASSYHCMVELGSQSANQEWSVSVYDSLWNIDGYGGGNAWATGITATTGWHSHVITYEGNTVEWYVDGASIGTHNHQWNTGGGSTEIGRRDGGSMWWNGTIDHVVLLNYSFTAAEASAFHNVTQGSYLGAEESSSATSFGVSLNEPINKTTTSDNTPDFNFTATGSESSYSCELFLNDTGYGLTNRWCYQESANVSSSCGGLSTGSYSFTAGWTNQSFLVDGDWSTGGCGDVDGEYFYINYTKPTYAQNDSLWQCRSTTNKSIPSTCWNQDPIQFRMFSQTVDAGILTFTCWNSSDWVSIHSGVTYMIYEEAMWWRLADGNTTNNTATTITANTSLSDGDYLWYVNCTVNSVTNQSDVYNITIDATSPTSDSPSDATHYVGGSVTIDWTLTDNIAAGYYYIEKNGSIQNASTAWVSGTTYNIWVNTTVAGSLNYTIHFNDSANNLGTPDEVIISIEPVNIAPAQPVIINISGEANNSIISDSTPDIYFNVTDNNATLSCEVIVNQTFHYGINSSTQNNTPTLLSVNSTLSDGTYNFSINCTDGEYGNISDAWTMMIDSTTPSIDNISWNTTGGLIDDTLIYNQIIDYIRVDVADLNSISVNITVKRPDDSLAVDSQAMAHESGNIYNYSTDITLSQPGTWTIYCSVNDSAQNWNTSSDTITVTRTTPTIMDGIYSYDFEKTTTRALIDGTTSYSYDVVGTSMNWSLLNPNWSVVKDVMNYTKNATDAKTFITLYFDGNYDLSNTYTNTTCSQINQNLTDLTITPYDDETHFIVIELNQSQSNLTNFTNSMAECIINATENKFPVYVKDYSDADLDSNWVSSWSMVRVSESSNITFINTEMNHLRTNTSKTRIYYNLTTELKDKAQDYHTRVMIKLRGIPIITSISYEYVAEVDGYVDDVIVFNNQTSAQNLTINVSSANRNTKDVWDSSDKKLIENNTNGNFTVEVPAQSYNILYFEDLSHLTLTSVWKESSAQLTRKEFNTSTGPAAGSYSINGANDVKIEIHDPTYGRYNQYFIHYEWINTSYLTNDENYSLIILSDQNGAALNASYSNLSKVYGYISVADYVDSDAWQSGKETEIDAWIDIYNIGGVFIDGLDTGASGSNFSTRFRNLVDYVQVSKDKSAICNDYTSYSDVGVGGIGDYDMKESFCGRWDGTVGSPTYSWETWSVDYDRAVWAQTKKNPQLAISYGNNGNTSRMMYCYAMFLVMYGTGNNNLFRYAQPDFQSQQEIFTFDPGNQLEDKWIEVNSTHFTRKYSNGIVHIYTDTHTWDFDDGRDVKRLEFCVKLQHYAANPSAATAINFTVNDDKTKHYSITHDEIGANIWDTATVCRNITSQYSANGKYVIRLFPNDRTIVSVNIFNQKNNRTGVFSWHDEDAGGSNYPGSEPSWTAYGRSGVDVDLNTTNWWATLLVNDSVRASVDTITTINQIRKDFTGGVNITLNSSTSYAMEVWSDTIIIGSKFEYLKYWNTSDWITISVSNTSTCTSNDPTWNETTIAGEIHKACYIQNLTNYTFRIATPHLSTQTYQILEDGTLPSLAYQNPTPDNNTLIIVNYTQINISISESNFDTFKFNWNGTNTSYTNSSDEITQINLTYYIFNTTKTSLTDGNYTYYGWANDTSGNENQTGTKILTIDEPPNPSVHSTPTNGYYTNDNTTTFNWEDCSDSSGIDKYIFRLWNDSALTELNVNKTSLATSTYTLTAGEQLLDGTYYWEVRCNTTNGVNSSWSSNWSFTVDTVSPSSTSPADASHYMGSSTSISWTLTDDAVAGFYYIERNGSVQNSSTAWVNNTPINAWVNASVTGSFNYTIHFNDSAGNDGTSNEVFILINPVIGISLSSPANASTTSDNSTDYVFTVSGSGTLYNCSVYLNNVNKSGNSSVINGSLTTLTSIEVADGNYSWYVNCSTNSSINQSLTYNITIDASVSLFPSVNLTSPSNASRLTGNNVTVNVTLIDSNPDTCLLEWNGVNESFASNTSTLFWSHKSTIDGLNYSFIVYCNNTAGNWNNSGTLHVLENNVSNISSVSVSASNSNVDANCSYVASNDSEGDTITAYYLWYINGVHSRSFTNTSLLDDSLFSQSDNLTCVVKLFDSYENSTPLNGSAIVGTATTGPGGTGGVRDVPTEPTNVSITSTFSFNLASSEVPFISGSLDQPSSRYNVIIRNSSDSVIHIGTFSSDTNRNFLYILPLIFPDIYTASITNLNDQLLSTIEITVISDTGRVFWQVVPNILDLELASRVCKSTQVFIVGDRPWNYSYVKETPLSADVSIERSNNILEICIDSEQLDSGESVYEFISLTSSYGSKVVALEITHKPCPTINGFGGGEISLFGAGVCMLHALGYALILFFISLLVTTYRTKEYNKLKFNIQRAFILFVAVVVVIVLINSDVINIDWVVLFEFLGDRLSL